MNVRNVKMETRRLNDRFAVIDIQGEVNAFAEEDLMNAFAQAMVGKAEVVILNFREMGFMTSSGIGLLVTLFIRANRMGKELVAVGLNPHYQRIFELTRLNETIRVFPTEEAAMKMAGPVSGSDVSAS
jgi:anti-sigma B factor antagonist